MNHGSTGPKIVERGEFTVIGLAARTSNANEMTAKGVIGELWGQLIQGGLFDKIPSKADGFPMAVYTEYASDHTGEYTAVVGARVSSDSDVPPGMVAKIVPAGKFAVFTSEKGPAPQVVPALWMKINSLPKTATGGDRTYLADYEIYDHRARDPQNMIVDVYVGIR